MIILIVVLVLSLIFGFVCYMAARTWRVPHVVLLFGVFLMSLVFSILSSAALKTHQQWKEKYQTLTSQLEQQQRQLELLEHGDVLAAEDDTPSLAVLDGEFSRLVVDRGRVWRNAKPAGGEVISPDVIQVQLNMTGWGDSQCIAVGGEEDEDASLEPIPEEGAPAATPPVDHGITAGMVLFGFLELGIPPSDLFQDFESGEGTSGVCRVPGFYSGSFRVDAVDGNDIKLVSILPLDDLQKAEVQKGQATWSLYEVMPVDSHDVLSGMPEEAVVQLFQGNAPIAQDYIRDQTPAQPGDPDNRTMRKIKFLRDYEVAVDVDGDEPGIDKNFSPDGRAILAHLRQGAPTEFKEGDAPDVFFPTEVANRLRRDGICEFVDEQPIYVRPLRDYRYYFYQKNYQIEQLRDLMEELKRENASIAATEARARDQQAYRETELKRLNEDRTRTDEELKLLHSHLADLQRQRQEQLSGLGSLYQWNSQQAEEIRGSRFYGAGRP